MEAEYTLVERAKAQRDILALRADPRPAQWTSQAQGLIDHQPERYIEIVGRIAEGELISQIAKELNVSKPTVRCIKARHPEALEGFRESIRNNIEEGLQKATQLLEEKLDKIPASRIALSVDILAKQAQLIQGSPTSIVRNERVPSPEDLQKMFESLPSANP